MAGNNSISATRPQITGSAFLAPDIDDAPPGPTGPHVIHQGVDAERSPHNKQVVVRQSHTTTNILFIIIMRTELICCTGCCPIIYRQSHVAG